MVNARGVVIWRMSRVNEGTMMDDGGCFLCLFLTRSRTSYQKVFQLLIYVLQVVSSLPGPIEPPPSVAAIIGLERVM